MAFPNTLKLKPITTCLDCKTKKYKKLAAMSKNFHTAKLSTKTSESQTIQNFSQNTLKLDI